MPVLDNSENMQEVKTKCVNTYQILCNHTVLCSHLLSFVKSVFEYILT